MSDIDWTAIHAGLIAHFAPEDVGFRPQQGNALAYIDARAVMDRLDAVVGPANWTFLPDPVVIGRPPSVSRDKPAPEQEAALVVRGHLTIHGVTKSALGDASPTEPSKSADSDALKRAAVLWGIGRYLYSLPHYPFSGNRIEAEDLKRLRAGLPRPGGVGGAAVPPPRAVPPAAPLVPLAVQQEVTALTKQLGFSKDNVQVLLGRYGASRFSQLAPADLQAVLVDLRAQVAAQAAGMGEAL